MILAKGLTKRFGFFEALKGIDLRVEKGEVYGFLGQNGAGKSTTMNILAGLSKADHGSCTVNGWDLKKVTHPGDLHIGYLTEEPKFYPWLTARENLTYLSSRLDKRQQKNRVSEMLEWVGLTKAANRRVGGFSRGMKQRLGMAAALIYDPELLLLDEPSSALDPEGRCDVLGLILDLKSRGKTVFLSTHILSDVERVCDRVGILSHGRMTMERPLKTLLRENVTTTYQVTLKHSPDIDFINRVTHLNGVNDIQVHHDSLFITVENAETGGRKLLSLLASSNVVVDSFMLKKASLEDIFLEEVGKDEYKHIHS